MRGNILCPSQALTIKIPITIDQLERADARVEVMEPLLEKKYGRAHLNNSIRAGYGMFVGFLGEELVHDFYQQLWGRSAGDAVFHWDLRDAVLGRVEVKTKWQKYPETPKAFYNCTVCDANTEQRCDWYCFVRVHASCECAWLLGFIPKQAFFDQAVFGKKGATDPTSHNGFTYKWDCWNVGIKNVLRPPATVTGLHELPAVAFDTFTKES